jgi:hypothetical protein
LNEIRFARSQRVSIVATFNGNLRFFESTVHRRLKAHRTLVLMDAGQYEQIVAGLASGSGPRYAGVRYSAEPVYVKGGVFHPKFILTLSGDRAHLLLGSGNLGEAGYMRNAELFCKMEAAKAEGRLLDEAGPVIVDLCAFLRCLTDEQMVIGDGAEIIRTAVAQWADAEVEIDCAVPRSTWLLHSLTQPILDQVAEKIGDQAVERIAVLSPYFDRSFTLFDHIVDRFGCKDIHLYVQPGISELPVEHAQEWPGRADVQLHAVDFPVDDGRSRNLHAKLVIWKTQSGAYCLSGSANFTQAAMESVALPQQKAEDGDRKVRPGNVEVALLRFDSRRDAFDYLLRPPMVRVEQIGWSEFRPGEGRDLPRGDKHPRRLRLLAARYRRHCLSLRFARAPSEAAELGEYEVWIHPIGQRAIRLPRLEFSGDVISISNVEWDGAAVAWIEALDSDSGDLVTSNKRWVDKEGLAITGDTGFDIEDFEECKELGGIEGVLEALRRARERSEDPEWLLAFLREWDLRAILEAGVREPPSSPPGLGTGGKPQPYPDKPDTGKLLSTGIRTLVDLEQQDVIDGIRDDYVSRIRHAFEACDDLQGFSLGFHYFTAYTNLLALILQALLERTADEREKHRRHQRTQHLHFVNLTGDYLHVYGTDWEELLFRGDRASGAGCWDAGEVADETAAEFAASVFLVHRIGQALHDIFQAEGHKVHIMPKMPHLKRTWRQKVTLNLREPALRIKRRGKLEALVGLVLERYQPALEAIKLELCPADVVDQLSSLFEKSS